MINIGINGLGRIGRCIIRAAAEANDYEDINIVSANATTAAENYRVLLQHDSVHGTFKELVRAEKDSIIIGKHNIEIYQNQHPQDIPWSKRQTEIVMECTGKFKKHKDCMQHIAGGARKVIISAPSDDADITVVYGVNHKDLKPEHKVVSIGSCTTNAFAPIAKALNDTVGITSGYMTTIHAYTSDQNLLDNRHDDIRRARACALSMVPTSTGAAKAIGLVIPELEGKIQGSAVRVPVPNVSMIDFVFNTKHETSKEAINEIIEKASKNEMKGVLAVAKDKLVSVDFNHNIHSSIFDPFETKMVGKNMVRVVSWYDNEWGFSNRMLDIARIISKL